MILSISFTGAGLFRLRMRCFFGVQWSDSVVVLELSGVLACFEPNAVSDRTLHLLTQWPGGRDATRLTTRIVTPFFPHSP